TCSSHEGGKEMKELSDLSLSDEVLYSDDHEWAKAQGDTVRIGVSDYAQDQLGDIVFVEVPEVGATFKKGDVFGTLESVKAVAEMLIPVGGEVVSVNTQLEAAPALVNQDPYDKGWIIEIKPADPSELSRLMKKDAYLEMLKGLGQ
ncbi:MAG: glycine cleavage system protein GcvH, partial [Syntrophobacteraceae bacterium]